MPGSPSAPEVDTVAEEPAAGRGSTLYGVGLAFGALELLLCGFGVFIVTRMHEVPHPLAGAIISLLTAGVALVPGLVCGVLFFLVRRRRRRRPLLVRHFWLPLLPPLLLCALTFGSVALIK